jgi:hypothetical protein
MHMPRPVFYARWRIYRWQARQHFLHHRHRRGNFNLSFPLFDHVLGTTVEPTRSDVREMLLLGLLAPRSAPAAARVARGRAPAAAASSGPGAR